MSLDNKNILAVIPARGGSKGIPRKNLRKVCGKSLVQLVYECIQQLPWIDASVLSTDDEEIANHGKDLGLNVPFMRPQELSTDEVKSIDVWIHAWLTSEEHYGKKFDISILLEPTSPMRRAEDVNLTVQKLLNSHANAVATVSKTPGHYTPHKTLKLANDGSIKPFMADGIQYSIRQTIPDYYHRNGVCYAVTRESLIDNHNLMESNCLPLIIERPIVNIDEEFDINFAEFMLTRK